MPCSLVELLASRVTTDGNRLAMHTPAASSNGPPQQPPAGWSWQVLATAALALAERLESAGLRRGDRLVHSGPHAVEWVVTDLACLLAGIVHAQPPLGWTSKNEAVS